MDLLSIIFEHWSLYFIFVNNRIVGVYGVYLVKRMRYKVTGPRSEQKLENLGRRRQTSKSFNVRKKSSHCYDV